MDINSNIQTNTPSVSPKFTGINHIMKKRLYSNTKFLEQLPDIFTRENGSVGTLPKDILNLIGLNRPKTEIAQKIEGVKDTLNNANAILSNIELKKLEIADNINPKNLINPFLPKLAKIEFQPSRIPRIFNQIRTRFLPPKEYLTEVSNTAGAYIDSRFKELGIIKPDDKVKLSYIDQGKFKNGFKLEILNKDDEQIIHPKVLLSFKDKKVYKQQFDKIIEIIQKYYSEIKEKPYQKMVDNVINNASAKIIPPEQKEQYRSVILKMYDSIKNHHGTDKYKVVVHNRMAEEFKNNGIEAETNLTQFIKNAAGAPLDTSNFIPIHYLNLKHNVGLTEFADTTLPKQTHKVNLYKLGQYHDDIEANKNNTIAGRIIDYGGIKSLPDLENIANNPIVRRYYNKVSQIKRKTSEQTQIARIDYWNSIYKDASKGKVPNHNDVLLALKVSKMHIKPQYWHKLMDTRSDAFGSL